MGLPTGGVQERSPPENAEVCPWGAVPCGSAGFAAVYQHKGFGGARCEADRGGAVLSRRYTANAQQCSLRKRLPEAMLL